MSNTVPKTLRRLRLLMGAFLLGVLLFASYEVVIHIAQPDAVQISQSVAATGHILAQRTITDPRTVADYYARINRLPELPPDTYYVSCLPINVPYYRVTFFYRGIAIENATFINDGCSPWFITRGPGPATRVWDPENLTQPILAQAQP